MAVVGLAGVYPLQLRATTVIPPDFATLVKRADVVMTGKVTEITSEWVTKGEHRLIRSRISFEVIRVLKGQAETPFVLIMSGGTVGGKTMKIGGAPKFVVGERSLLFVEKNGAKSVPLVGMMFGRFRIVKDPDSGDDNLIKADGTTLRGRDEIDATAARGAYTFRPADSPSPSTELRDRMAARERGALKLTDFEEMIRREVDRTASSD